MSLIVGADVSDLTFAAAMIDTRTHDASEALVRENFRSLGEAEAALAPFAGYRN